jgi:hypothetical protein
MFSSAHAYVPAIPPAVPLERFDEGYFAGGYRMFNFDIFREYSG